MGLLNRKKSCWVCFINKKGEISIEKGHFVHDLVIKTSNRLVIKTVDPLYYKKKEIYFVYLNDPHTYDIQNSKIISEELFEFVRKMKLKRKYEVVLTQEPNRPEDLTPHKATEKLIGYIISQQTLVNFLKSFLTLERRQLIGILIYIGLGFFMGLSLGLYWGGG